jgi:hypothetical protein
MAIFDLTIFSWHHNAEENVFFPEVVAITGEKGVMGRNIEQISLLSRYGSVVAIHI